MGIGERASELLATARELRKREKAGRPYTTREEFNAANELLEEASKAEAEAKKLALRLVGSDERVGQALS